MFLVDDSVYTGRRPIILDDEKSVKTFLGNLEASERPVEYRPKLYLVNEIDYDIFLENCVDID